MTQTDLTAFLKMKRKKIVMYRFVKDVPPFLDEELREYGPFRRGDLVSEGALPKHVVEVLLKRGIVVPYSAKL